MHQIVITEFMDQPAVQDLSEKFHVVYDPKLVDQPQSLAPLLAKADALIVRNRTQVNEALLSQAGKLKVVGRLGVGLDNIDLKACAKRSIEVIPATGANARAVAEYVIGAAFYLIRAGFTATAQVASGDWPRLAYSNGREIEGKTLGLIGFGFIGQMVAQMAHSLGMKVIAYDPALAPNDSAYAKLKAQAVPTLTDLLKNADIVSLHVPFIESTKNLMNQERIGMMKKGSVLINTSRGGIVDENALIAALKSGHLGGAALDVFEKEPLPAGAIASDISSLIPNLILTPHIAGITQESNARVSTLIAQRVKESLEKLK